MKKINLKEKIIFIFWVFIFCCLINLYGCFSYTLRAESIAIDETTVPDEITIDDFDLSEIKLLVTRVDGSIDSVSLTEDMLSKEALKKLKKSGTHYLYVRYDEKLTILTISLVEKYSNVTISFETNGGNKISSQSIEKYTKAFRPINPTKEGYIFSGWYLDKELTKEFLFSTIIYENITLYAKWTEALNVIKYNTNDSNEIPDSKVKTGEKLYKITPAEKEGYEFKGWYLDKECTKKFDFDSPITSDITLYAKFVIAKCKVEFETNGGSFIEAEEVEYKNTINENKNIVTTRSDAVFLGWYLDEEFTIEFNRTDIITKDIVLYAKWQMNDINVSFDTDGGNKVETQNIKYGNKATLPEQPKKVGYIFVGWYCNKDFDKEYDFDTLVYEDTIIYARWVIDSSSNNKYSVAIYGDEFLDSFKVEEGSTLSELVAPEQEYKVFVDWYKDPSMSVKYDLNEKIYSNVTLYAKYVDAYTVEFLDINGNIIATQKVGEGFDAKEQKAPELKGYTFSHWDKDLKNIRSNIVTKPIYTTHKYEVNFIVDGKVVSSQKVSNGVVPDEPTDFDEYISEGYHFKSWNKEISNIYQDTTYVAVLEKNVYEVKFVDYYENVFFSTSIRYGEKIVKPNDKINEFYEALNWFEDKSLTKLFDFDKIIKEETSIYGCFDFSQSITFVSIDNEIIIRSIDASNISELKIPGNLNDKKVVSVKNILNSDNVKKIYVPSSITELNLDDLNIFNLEEINVSNGNDYYESLNGVLYEKGMKKLLIYPKEKAEEKFVIPSKVVSIGDNAFNGNQKLAYIDLGNVSFIGTKSFANTNILSFIINNNNIAKEKDAFENCNPSLKLIVNKELYSDYLNKWNDMKDNIYSTEFIYNDYLYQIVDNKVEIVEYLGSDKHIEIPSIINGMEVVSINSYAFNSNYDLRGITLPNTIKKIDDNSLLNLKLEYIKINSLIDISNDYIKELQIMLENTNVYVLDSLYNDYNLKLNRVYKISQIYEDYAYIIKNGSCGILQYFGEERDISIPKKYKEYAIDFIDENFIVSDSVTNITIYGMVNVNSVNINKGIFFLVDEKYLDDYLKFDYAFYSNKMNVYNDLHFIYGELDGVITILKITSKFEKFVVSDYLNGKKVVNIGRYSMMENDYVKTIEIGENIVSIGKNGLKTKKENELKIIFKSLFAPKIEDSICYESDHIYKIDFEQKEYLERFAGFDVTTFNSVVKENDDYKYCILNEKVSIIEYLGNAREVIIPDKIDGYDVISIEAFAFSGKRTVVKVIIPNTVLRIGYLAFSDMKNLKEVIIDSEKVVYIEKEIVQKPILIRVNDSLLYRYRNSEVWSRQEVIAKSSEVIDDGYFQYIIENNEAIIIKIVDYDSNTKIKSSLGKYQIKRLGAYSFYDTDIVTITINSQIDEIGYNAFPMSLKTLTLSDSLPPKIAKQESSFDVVIKDEYYFDLFKKDEEWNKYNLSMKGIEKSSNADFEYLVVSEGIIITRYIGNSLELVIPDEIDNQRVIAIGEGAFKDSLLESVKFGEHITSVYDYAFYNCQNLEDIEFSNNIISIGERAFDDTKWLKTNNNDFIVIGHVLYKYSGKYKLDSKITLSDGIVSIAPYAFENNVSITEVVFPSSLKVIGKGAFENCINLVKIELPRQITRIEDETFKNCSRLKKVLFEKKLVEIGKKAFENCVMLSEFDFYNVEVIEDCAFSGCEKLNKIYLPSTINKIGNNVFEGCNLLSEITIEDGAAYKIVDGILYDKTKTILYEDLLKHQRREIIIPITVNLIEKNAFANSLVEKVIITGKTTIGNSAFVNNEYLIAIVFATSNVPTISETSFEPETNLYFSNKIYNEIRADYLYDKYIVHSILEFSQTEYDLKVNEELKLVPICPLKYNDNEIVFKSDNEKILLVENGNIKAKGVGKVDLTVTLNSYECYEIVISINIKN